MSESTKERIEEQPEEKRKGKRALRYIEPGMAQHVLNSTTGRSYFMRPRESKRRLICGTIGHYQSLERHRHVRIHGYAFMENHFHMLMTIAPDAAVNVALDEPDLDMRRKKQVKACSTMLARFMADIQRELSDRIQIYDVAVDTAILEAEASGRFKAKEHLPTAARWEGHFWRGRYGSSALPTTASEKKTLRYILAQGVKEHKVERCTQWPGPHMAHAFTGQGFERGTRLDATAYSAAWARYETAKAAGEKPKPPKRSDYETEYEVVLTPPPSFGEMDWETYSAYIQDEMRAIERKAQQERQKTGRQVLGVKRVMRGPEKRRNNKPLSRHWRHAGYSMVVWASSSHPLVKAYLARYRDYQKNPPPGVRRAEPWLDGVAGVSSETPHVVAA